MSDTDTSMEQETQNGEQQVDENEENGIEEKDGIEEKEGAEEYVVVKFLHSSETLLCKNTLEEKVEKGDYVIASSRYGNDMAVVLGEPAHLENYSLGEAKELFRKAGDEDIEEHKQNLIREEEALEICKEKIKKHGLEMKLVSAHYLLDESKILFFFTADARVDFRELVKDLVSVFKMRIELRQIGVRDESRVLGGMAVCGRKYCCHGITDKLNPVSIKMAKEQNLSLNSMKISGPCGRLLCCLSYEYDFYKEEKSRVPREGNRVRFRKEEYKVNEVNILSRKVHLVSSDGGVIEAPLDRFTWNKDTHRWEIDLEGLLP
ncbi:MAG: regulatory iron-sulfur-containing complex subunit RicT [Spirochaetia bacterium]